jgi:hypothetical protein
VQAVGTLLRISGTRIHDVYYRDYFHPHVQSGQPIIILHVSTTDGVGRIPACCYSLLAFSPFNLINKVMGDAGEKAGRMLSAEASHGWMVEGCADQAAERVTRIKLGKKYPWWTDTQDTIR